MYIVYKHTNKFNNKPYVGWSSLSVEERWSIHVFSAKHGSKCIFHKAIRKYGSGDDVWDHQILEVLLTKNSAKQAEKLWIAELKTNALREDHYGYNMTDGGEGVSGPRTKEHSQKLANALRGKSVSHETRQKISVANRGKKRSKESRQLMREKALGKKLSQLSRKKVSDASKLRFESEEFREKHKNATKLAMNNSDIRRKNSEVHRKSVHKCDCDGNILATFSSVNEAALSINVTCSSVSHVLNGRMLMCRGYIFKYASQEEKTIS